jgi:hypothetical protein
MISHCLCTRENTIHIIMPTKCNGNKREKLDTRNKHLIVKLKTAKLLHKFITANRNQMFITAFF